MLVNARDHFRSSALAASLLWGVLHLPAHAVIVAGTLGTGNNNDTQAGLNAYLATTSYAAFPYWDNLVRVGTASGVYLGYNASTSRGWVLSANHIAAPTSINVLGNSYAITGSSTQIGTSDLKLYEIGGGVLDPALPMLSTAPLAAIAATAGEFLLMTGRGFTTSINSPYVWGYAGANDAYGMRWGTNTVLGTALVDIGPLSNFQPYVVVDFSGRTDPGTTAYDAQGAIGDSGGGMFIYRGGQWVLSGIAHFVTSNAGGPAQLGDFTAYSDVFSKVSAIQSITGTLIPEPSVLGLLAAGLFPLIMRRRPDRD